MSLNALYDVPAPAKLNLFLHVVGRRDDGYHLLQSLFVLIDWCDWIHFELRPGGALSRQDLGPALPAVDLCLRAARALQHASGTTEGVHISIDKQLPWGAGLGGGSSDAASTLLALNRLWRLHWPRERLLALAATLGADVPFFVGGDSAFVQGAGEQLTPLALPRQRFVVLKPPAGVSTAEVFASPQLQRGTAIISGSFASAGHDEAAAWCSGFGRNDLQAVAQALVPEVAAAALQLQQRYGNSRMTGSGSAVFARVGSDDASTTDWQGLPAGWVVRSCRSLDRHPLRGWAS